MTMHTISRCLMSFVAITALTLFPAVSQASLIGDTITGDGYGQVITGGGPTDAVVGAGVEFTGGLFSVDVGASSVRLDTTYTSGSQNIGGTKTVNLTDLDWVGLSGIVVGTENVVNSGFPNFNVTGFTDDSVTFTFSGSILAGSFASFDLVTEHVTPAPEPSSVVLTGMALLGLGMRRRRRTR